MPNDDPARGPMRGLVTGALLGGQPAHDAVSSWWMTLVGDAPDALLAGTRVEVRT
ncbi:hypothetical protein [Nocardioides sp. TF02-7]|uniref:hypothetical protein n=1 Tax=Nocardioides sp. TF02-7 TaxID=2917724 RepID=UPI001F070E2F|nr:hypothetical protein [Nocardioides sp. TF02-7]UMG94114.1 hypothetical protein MF408_08785 [Nocardioides sp. TF02-7]